jgi:hypothetical protein
MLSGCGRVNKRIADNTVLDRVIAAAWRWMIVRSYRSRFPTRPLNVGVLIHRANVYRYSGLGKAAVLRLIDRGVRPTLVWRGVGAPDPS